MTDPPTESAIDTHEQVPDVRRDARILAMQALSQNDAQEEMTDPELEDFFAHLGAAAKVRSLAGRLVRSYVEHRAMVDQTLQDALQKWSLARLELVDRNVMRVAVVELLAADTPPKVVLNEAIEIVREYAGGESPRFVNGVLDRVLKELSEDIA